MTLPSPSSAFAVLHVQVKSEGERDMSAERRWKKDSGERSSATVSPANISKRSESITTKETLSKNKARERKALAKMYRANWD